MTSTKKVKQKINRTKSRVKLCSINLLFYHWQVQKQSLKSSKNDLFFNCQTKSKELSNIIQSNIPTFPHIFTLIFIANPFQSKCYCGVKKRCTTETNFTFLRSFTSSVSCDVYFSGPPMDLTVIACWVQKLKRPLFYLKRKVT